MRRHTLKPACPPHRWHTLKQVTARLLDLFRIYRLRKRLQSDAVNKHTQGYTRPDGHSELYAPARDTLKPHFEIEYLVGVC